MLGGTVSLARMTTIGATLPALLVLAIWIVIVNGCAVAGTGTSAAQVESCSRLGTTVPNRNVVVSNGTRSVILYTTCKESLVNGSEFPTLEPGCNRVRLGLSVPPGTLRVMEIVVESTLRFLTLSQALATILTGAPLGCPNGIIEDQ